MSSFLNADDAGITEAARLLRSGACVAVPTETVYGLAADAMNETAVRQIFAIKGRPLIDPLIVHLAEPEQLDKLIAANAKQRAVIERLVQRFWPGPLTIVAPKQDRVLDLVTANRDSVAVRCPAHLAMRRLLKASGLFLAAPSANPFGYVSPTQPEHVAHTLGERCPHILDGGLCQRGVESTIIDVRDPTAPILLRPGPIPREELANELEVAIALPSPSTTTPQDVSIAPGQLDRHYSPNKPIILHATGSLAMNSEAGIAQVYLQRRAEADSPSVFWLSESGALEDVAQNLFGLLHQLDQESGIAAIHCEIPEAGGLADAIIDRLTRASRR